MSKRQNWMTIGAGRRQQMYMDIMLLLLINSCTNLQ